MRALPSAGADQNVEWEEVSDLAHEAFHVWVGKPELVWAKKAWSILGKAGLTAYRSKVEHHQVLFRLLVLSGVYSDFCEVAFDETSDIEYGYSIEFDRFIGGQLWAQVPGWSFCEEEIKDSDILNALVECHRGEVVDALFNGFGGEAALYESLWKSNRQFDNDEDEAEEDAFGGSVLQCRAYEWIMEGCQRLH